MSAIAIDAPPVSELHDNKRLMSELMEQDEEGWARLSGLMAMLALPPVGGEGRDHKRLVEIELKPDSDQWEAIDSVAIEPERLLFWRTNGVRTEFVFLRSEGVPRWRMDGASPRRRGW